MLPADTLADECDNLRYNPNLDQTDFDRDGDGDACDLDDGHDAPPMGKGVFDLVVVTTTTRYEGIGNDSAGNPRNDSHPCP